MALTLKMVQSSKLKRGRYGDGGGLLLQVSGSGTKSWVFRYERDGKERMMGLGSAKTLSLPEARERARQQRLLLLDGIDPLDARNRRRAASDAAAASLVSFETAAREWYAAKEGGWKSAKHVGQVIASLENLAFPTIGSLAVAEIETPHIMSVLKPIWSSIPETASRLRGRIENVLNFAVAAGYRSGERPNPARWKGHLDHLLANPKKLAKNGNGERHFASLPYIELPAFFAELTARPGVAARALQFLVLTAARTSEVRGATWNEIDFEQKLWTIPGSRMKAGEAHEVPLSDPAIELLTSLPTETGNRFVFLGSRSNGLSNAAMLAVLGRVDKSNPEPDCSEEHESCEAFDELVIAGGDPA